jgi:hypothetical protein
MTVSRVTTWSAGNTLTATALNGEFDNLVTEINALPTDQQLYNVMDTDYGATRDGSTDDRAGIQAALTAAAGDGGGTVYFPGPGTYVVGSSGNTKTYRTTAHYYCLLVHSNTKLLFGQGVTIKLKSAANASLFMNADIAGAGNSNIAIEGPVTFDINQANQTAPATGEQAGIFMHTITNLVVRDVKFTNVREYAMKCTGITKGSFRDLWCTDSDGSAFQFGLDDSDDYWMRDCYFDAITAESTLGGFAGASGNGFILAGEHCVIGSVIQNSCYAGIKIQDTSSDISATCLISRSTAADHGIKIIGTSSGSTATRINLGRLNSTGSFHAGVYLENITDCAVEQIVSSGDATDAQYPAVWVGTGSRINIGSINVTSTDLNAVVVRDDASLVTIGRIIFHDIGVDTESDGVQLLGDDILIGEVIGIDSRGGSAMTTACVRCNGANRVSVGRVIYSGSLHATGQYNTINGSSTHCLIHDMIANGSRVKTITSGTTVAVDEQFPIYEMAHASGTTVTDFTAGQIGQKLTLVFTNGNTTLTDGTNLDLAGGITGSADDTMQLLNFDGTNWKELSRSVN